MQESSRYASPRLDQHSDRRISDRDDLETEDYPLKYTSSYSLEGTNPSGTADLHLRSGSVDHELQEQEVKYNSDSDRDVGEIFVDFCSRTSSHGIPHIGSSPSLIGKLFWTVVFLACSVAFIVHTYHTITIYLEYSVILQMQLEFNPAPFPAVTVCNLNPYKQSALSNVSEIYDQRIFALDHHSPTAPSVTRAKRDVYYEPVLARCRCLSPVNKECVPSINIWEPVYSTCLCYLDVNSGNIWPCYDVTVWTDHRCVNCSTTNACPFPPRRADATRGEVDEACVCQGISKFCVKRPDGPVRMWEGYKHGLHEFTTEEPERSTKPVLRSKVFDNADTVSIEIQEIISFTVATLDVNTRRNLSYHNDEFVLLCSFNGAQCIKERDFRLHDTPRHGNCYTYNYNESVNLKNSRAGPLYGLRLLLNVNQSDYLPYIEGAGVRVVVHHQTQYPFPDTFGYSAPTGAISSFGLKYKRFQRKGYPWSMCNDVNTYNKKQKDYLYDEEYSTEGCFRSCLQKSIVEKCECGSHRFPNYRNNPMCNYLNTTQKNCINDQEEKMNKNNTCSCLQPCSEPVYQTSYSAASWPADNYFNPTHCAFASENNQSCSDYFNKHTAFIEVFYEQLNFEKLTEVEAYTIFSLFADFGGNIGLWIGFSTITFVEFLELGLELFYHCYYLSSRPARRRRHKLNKEESLMAMQYVNQVAEQSYHHPHRPNIYNQKEFTVESSLSSIMQQSSDNKHVID